MPENQLAARFGVLECSKKRSSAPTNQEMASVTQLTMPLIIWSHAALTARPPVWLQIQPRPLRTSSMIPTPAYRGSAPGKRL